MELLLPRALLSPQTSPQNPGISDFPSFWGAVCRVWCPRPGSSLPGPNEYGWALHKRGFVSLNSFTARCPRKGYSELNVNHRFTGTERAAWRSFSKTPHLITGGSSRTDPGGRRCRSHPMGHFCLFLPQNAACACWWCRQQGRQCPAGIKRLRAGSVGFQMNGRGCWGSRGWEHQSDP